MQKKLVITLVLSLLAVMFIVQNSTIIQISFLIWEIDISQSLL